VQFEDYTTCDGALKVCGKQTVNQLLGQHLTRTKDDQAAEHKTTFMDILKELEASRKYVCHLHTENNITVTCNKVENELYRAKEKKKQNTLIEQLNEYGNWVCITFSRLSKCML
jgi:hypothetical protein